MPHNDSIINMLNLKDENIIFDEIFCTEETFNKVKSKVFHAKLLYQPKACKHCGHIFDENIIKHGFKLSRITLPKVSEFDTYLALSKQRYLCKHCGHTFSLSTPLVKTNCFISNNTKIGIALKANDKISEKDIAKYFNVSHCTVNRIIDDYYKIYHPKKNYLPRNLCFDEFKSVKSASGAMSFIFCDAASGKVIDIVEDRKLGHLIKYFMTFTKAARHAVRTIVIDMYAPYISLINQIFPNARIIFDRFHITQLVSRALNKTRIRIMNENKQYYNKLKRYYKLLLTDSYKIDNIHSRYNTCFKRCMCQADILDYLLDIDPVLKATYILYQEIRTAIRYKKISGLKYILENTDPMISDYMKTSVKSLLKHFDYVANALKFHYSNGRLEGINNKIKVIKRIAFGYRSFYHFRKRILISMNVAILKAA